MSSVHGKNSTSLFVDCMREMSVCGGVGGSGLEHLPRGLLHMDSLSNEGTTWASSAGLGVDGSTLQGKQTWEGRDFFGSHPCELGLFLCPFKEETSINNPIIKSMSMRDSLLLH